MKRSFVSITGKGISACMRHYGLLLLLLSVFSGILHAQSPRGPLPDGGYESVELTLMRYATNVGAGANVIPWEEGVTIATSITADGASTLKYRNVISLYVDEQNGLHVLPDFTQEVQLEIKYKAALSDPWKTLNKTLKIEYKKGAGELSDVRQYITFEGAAYVEVKLVSDVPPVDGAIDYRDILTLENLIYVTRYYTLTNNPLVLNPSYTPSSTDDNYYASWSYPVEVGANAVQLEWAWLEDDLESIYYVGGTFTTASKEKLLRDNSSRVELPFGSTGYQIPMFYSGKGKLYYRVRGISIQPSGTRILGPWSAIAHANFDGHEEKLNWQSTTAYAEEGKNTSVVQYFDGSLRGRQTVTNGGGAIMVAESFYDGEGRPAVQVLPAPTVQYMIGHQKGLNLFNTPAGTSMTNQTMTTEHADYFDYYFDGGASPTLNSGIEGSTSYYYSPNKSLGSWVESYLPDAEGYPYALTRYTPDGTGRIQAQSGVGTATKMGSNRETKYYYGSAKQEELDALFGTEVGDKSHYFKNMVKDANGQMSVSYVDMHGRTIATALAGDNPDNLQKLGISNATYYPNQDHAETLTVNLLDNNSNIVKGNSIESVTSLLVPADNTDYTFTYTLTPQSLSLNACDEPATVCYECLYDLQIVVMDESGEKVAPEKVMNFSNLSVEFDSLCSTPTRLFQNLDNLSETRTSTVSFTLELQPGSYSIRKTLTLNEEALQKLKANYLERSRCELDYQVIFDSVYNEVKAVTQCDNPPTNPQEVSCAECEAQVGTLGQFTTQYLASINYTETPTPALTAEINAAYNEAKANCELLCGTAALEIITKRELMLADMIPPFGQYAKEYTNSTTMERKYNIFSTFTPATQPFFRKPKVNPTTFAFYLDPFGNTDPLIHTTPEILSAMTDEDFELRFQNNWAEQLLPYHPEYSRLIFAETNLKPSYNWMHSFFAVSTYSQAVTEGYIFTTEPELAAKDPFFAIGSAASKKTTMKNWLTGNYMAGRSLWQYAYYTAICKRIPGASGCTSPSTGDAPPFSSLSAADRDSVWSKFKGLYLQARTTLMDEYIAEQDLTLTLANENDLVAQGYFLHFPRNKDQQVTQTGNNSGDAGDWSFWPPDPTTGEPNLPANWGTPAQQQQVYKDRCEANIAQWKLWFDQCPALNAHPNKAAILTILMDEMVKICRKGSNEANPFGASEVAPSTPVDGSYRSFEELINTVFHDYNILRSDVCNPFIIEYPKAYGKGTPVTTQYTTAIDSCHCDLFTEIKEDAIKGGKNPNVLSSLNEYLWQTYGDTLSLDLFNAFQRCNEIGDTLINNCDSVIVNVTASCEIRNPCAGNGTIILQMENEIPVAAKSSKPGGNFCLEGYVWDPVLETCVPEGGTNCPPGYVWDSFSQQCVMDMPGCPPGYVWDAQMGQCVPLLEEECEYRCFKGMDCDTTVITNIELPTAVPLPAFLQCGSTGAARCITCTDIRALKTEFNLYFEAPYENAPIQGSTNLSETDIAYNKNFARFLNYRTGFSFSWGDYMRSIDSTQCNLGTGGNQTVICRDYTLTDTTGVFVKPDPCQATYDMATHIAQQVYELRLQWYLGEFERQYRAKCMAAGKDETFTVAYKPTEYHYTLYYYDQAGNLVKTVPPAGVRPDYSTAYLNDIKAKRAANQDRPALHEKVTQYRYNGLNQVVAQTSPDGGTSKFWYDRLGRLAVSQNAEQALHNQYSYTKYDNLGRITEVGQKANSTAMTQTISRETSSLTTWLNGASLTDQLTITVYDEKYTPLSPDPDVAAGIDQQNLRNRVSYSMVKALSTDTWHTTATFYTYDIHGNVNQLLQDYRGIADVPATDRLKTIKYQYDLISGKVNEVAYQPGAADAFYHRYSYDAKNRLFDVLTSRDAVHWQYDVEYEYYAHGPLARMSLGNQVQGIDYAYTLQGWLKGVNSTSLRPDKDMGSDGLYSAFGRDVYGYALHYYDNAGTEYDYKPIGGTNPFARPNNSAFKSLYNGNIGAMTVNNGGLKKGNPSTTNSLPLFYNYSYDQLNRIVGMQAYKGLNESTNVWTPVSIQDYAEATSYDPDGNILTYSRNGAPEVGMPQKMDELSYEYYSGNNRLRRVGDNTSLTNNYYDDIDNQSNANNYTYDAIGNLKTDVSEGIISIDWTVYGKIGVLNKQGDEIIYHYDASGNRISKTYMGVTTLYVRDASGNVMSVYEVSASDPIVQKEVHLYGSSRLGMATTETRATVTDALATGFNPAKTKTQRRGEKVYELSNHLGNVLATITDKKLQKGKPAPLEGELAYIEADVVTATDYYPFGMSMPGRKVASEGYRYGFNGQEKSTELDQNGNSMTAEYWQYDARLGRRWNVDPVVKEYESCYAAFSNNPVRFVDPTGADSEDPVDPSGRGLLLPSYASVTQRMDPSANITVAGSDNVQAKGQANAVMSFTIGDRNFEARFELAGGEFTRYADQDGNDYKVEDYFEVSTSSNWTRLWGGLQAVGGGFEMVIGGGAVATGGGSVVGTLAVVHGADNVTTGLYKLWYGEERQTFTEKAISAAIGSKYAGTVNAVIGMALSGGISNISRGVATSGTAKTAQATTEVANELSVAEQAALLGKRINKNSFTVGDLGDGMKMQYDFIGATHRGVATPHVQLWRLNVTPNGVEHYNKVSKFVIPMTQKHIDYLKNYFNQIGY